MELKCESSLAWHQRPRVCRRGFRWVVGKRAWCSASTGRHASIDLFWFPISRTNWDVRDLINFLYSPGTFESISERSKSRLKIATEQFWYKLLLNFSCYKLFDPTSKCTSVTSHAMYLLRLLSCIYWVVERRQEQNHKFIDVQRCTDKNKKGQVLSVTRGARAHDRPVYVETYGVRLEMHWAQTWDYKTSCLWV